MPTLDTAVNGGTFGGGLGGNSWLHNGKTVHVAGTLADTFSAVSVSFLATSTVQNFASQFYTAASGGGAITITCPVGDLCPTFVFTGAPVTITAGSIDILNTTRYDLQYNAGAGVNSENWGLSAGADEYEVGADVVNGSGGQLLVFFHNVADFDPLIITYNGVTMTKLGSFTQGPQRTGIYYISLSAGDNALFFISD